MSDLNFTALDVELLPARTTMTGGNVFDASGGSGSTGILGGNILTNLINIGGTQNAEAGTGGDGGANVVGK